MQALLINIDRLSTLAGKLFAWCVLILTAVVTYEVFARYLFRAPTAWAYDVSYILYGALFMMTGAYALSRNQHVRADVIYRLLSVRTQGWLDLTLYVLFFFPGVIALMYAGFNFAKLAWMIGERSSFSPGGPPLYHFKALIPIAGFFLFLQGLAESARAIIAIRTGEWPSRLHDVEELEKVMYEQAVAQPKEIV